MRWCCAIRSKTIAFGIRFIRRSFYQLGRLPVRTNGNVDGSYNNHTIDGRKLVRHIHSTQLAQFRLIAIPTFRTWRRPIKMGTISNRATRTPLLNHCLITLTSRKKNKQTKNIIKLNAQFTQERCTRSTDHNTTQHKQK